ncbi:MAG: class I SAM-dependent methyltransferase [Candidatus Omnitrophica bacterium]|nr:class I SAM-dependent methyltransferase [Candidatus Omnitrophota bacterium]
MTTEYYSNKREEILRLIPKGARTVLDAGCWDGTFAALAKKELGAEVWGIEINADAAQKARGKLDKVIERDISEAIKELPDAKFDCIVFNDSLEHLADPYSVLEAAKEKLAPGGVVACSIPNMRYFPVLCGLAFKKEWRYTDTGVLDRTHLRFFTEKSIKEMFEGLDYEVLELDGINGITTWKFNLLNILTFGLINDTRYMQFACSAKRRQ